MNLKNITSLNPDVLAQALDDVISLLAALLPTLAPEAQTAMGAIAIGDTLANALLPVFAPVKPAPVVQPAQQPAPAPVVEAKPEPMTLAQRAAAQAG